VIRRLALGITLIVLAARCQQPGSAPAAPPESGETRPKNTQPKIRVIENGNGLVGVNPNQPYRPIPLNSGQSRETIFEFYFRALNPRQVKWGDVINERLANLSVQSVGNPYFWLCALQFACIVVLMLVCWLWWDKLHQVKRVASESLTDAINGKLLADAHAMEAIAVHNRHMDACNRVIEAQHSGNPGDAVRGGWLQEMDDLKSKLSREQAENVRLSAQLKAREDQQAALESRIGQLEIGMRGQQGGANAELVARLQRAESQLASNRGRK